MSRKLNGNPKKNPDRKPRRVWIRWALTAAALILGFGAWVWSPWQQDSVGQPMRMNTEMGSQQALVLTNPFSTDARIIARGKEIFAANCAVCHGENAVGEEVSSPMGGEKPNGDWLAPALNGRGHGWHHRPQELVRMIMFGSPRPGSRMQGWEGKLSDEDLNSILAYLYSIWPQQIQARYLYRPHH
jgi:mono/diheme cytochrome c family protein